MWNEPTQEQLDRIPNSSEHIQLRDKTIWLHFFLSGCDWYICEYDGEDLFFAFCILNGDLINAEWGYVSFNELKAIKVAGAFEVDCDLYWNPKPASEIDKIRRAHRWVEEGGECYV